jgi:hypothetical protein
MANLKRASQQLFARPDDERFESFQSLQSHCQQMKENSNLFWHLPTEITPSPFGLELGLQVGGNGIHSLTDWSFGQMCSIADVKKDTVNRLSPDTASRVLRETVPGEGKPLQLLTYGNTLRSIHGASYTRIFDSDLLEVVRNEADGFDAPPKGFNGATGFYAGQANSLHRGSLFGTRKWDAERSVSKLSGFNMSVPITSCGMQSKSFDTRANIRPRWSMPWMISKTSFADWCEAATQDAMRSPIPWKRLCRLRSARMRMKPPKPSLDMAFR